MIYNKRKLQIYTASVLTTLMIIMGFAWATHALSIYRATMERQIAEDNDIVKDNLSIIIHQVTQQNTDRNPVTEKINALRTHLAGTGFLIVAISGALSWFFLGMLVDRYESYLSRSETRNRTLVENSSPILITSPSGHLLDGNPEALALFQTDRTKLLSKNIQDLWPEKNRPDLSSLFSITLENTIEYHDLDLQTDNGHIIPVDVRACRITYGEAEHLRRVVANLLDNAIKYTPKGGTVFMHVSEEIQGVKIEITDSGIGISCEDLPHIFEKFYHSEKVEVQ